MKHRCALTLAIFLLLHSATAARAQVGVSVDLSRIAVNQALSPGGSYTLPTIGVTNPGTERSTYQMGLSYMEGQGELVPPLEWFTFSPASFTLDPGATRAVSITLDVPASATPGSYAALLQAQLAVDGAGGRVGAAAASRLSFNVRPSTILQGWLVQAQTFFRRYAPWMYAVPAGAALMALGGWVSRRFSFRVERRR